MQTLPEGKTVSDEFLVLLACGRARSEMQTFLVDELTANVWFCVCVCVCVRVHACAWCVHAHLTTPYLSPYSYSVVPMSLHDLSCTGCEEAGHIT